MTWKKLFFKLTLHDMKKRSWCMALLFLFQFLAIPVSALLAIQNYREFNGQGSLFEYQRAVGNLFEQDIFDFANLKSVLFLIAGAVILAMTGFSYLNAKKKVDFVHSMPVKREALFFSRYLTGLVLYMGPLILNVGIGLLAVVMLKCCNIYVIKNALCFLFYHLVYFLLFYSTSVLAIVLVGNFVVSLVGIGILCTYQTVLWFILVNLKEHFFQTYMRIYQTFRVYDPAGLFIRQIISFNNNYYTWDYDGNRVRIGTQSYYSTGWEVALIAFLLTVAITAAAFVLFRIRKSESAGKSLAFPKLEAVVKVALLIPASLTGALVFYGLAAGYRKLWYAFGAVLFCILTAMVIEMVFRQDFKSLLKHKKSALAGGGLALAVTLCFWFDLFGFDSRIPKSGQIASVGVSIPKVETQEASYYESDSLENVSLLRWIFNNQMEPEEYNSVLYNCRIEGEGVEQVRTLAGYFVKNKQEFEDIKRSDYLDPAESWIASYENPKEESRQFVECQVVFRLKNGRNVYRAYRMPYGEEFLEAMEPVFANEEYRKASEPIFQDEENYRYLHVTGNLGEKNIQIARSSQKEILECLKKDRENLTFADAWTKNKCGCFYMINNLGSKQSERCYVYESDTNTLNWLEENKAGMITQPEEITVISASVDYFLEKEGTFKRVDLEEEKEKKEIIPYLVRSEFIAPEGQINIERNMSVMLEYTVKQDENRIPAYGDAYWEESESTIYMDTFYLKDAPPFLKALLDR